MQAANISALASVNALSKPPMAYTLLPMAAPDVNERTVFMFAEARHSSVAGRYTFVVSLVEGSWILQRSFAAAAAAAFSSLRGKTALEDGVPGIMNGLPPPKTKSESNATALPRTLF